MSDVKIRALRADEVEVRVSEVTAKGVQLLIYKDSRVDKRVLDETFGVFGWRNHYEEIMGVLYCTIEVKDPATGEWIAKCDCGTESNTEAEKGRASDAFKRAGFALGIGRELYTKIFIFLRVPTVDTGRKKQNGKPIYDLADRYAKWVVTKMEVDEKTEKITKLVISQVKNGRYDPVFSWTVSTPPVSEDDDDTLPPEVTQAPICRVCGQPIYAAKGKDGVMRDAQFISEACGGMCTACFKTSRTRTE